MQVTYHTLAVRIALLSFKNVVKIPVGHHLLCCFLRLILLLGGFFSDLGKKKVFPLFLWLVWCAAAIVWPSPPNFFHLLVARKSLLSPKLCVSNFEVSYNLLTS